MHCKSARELGYPAGVGVALFHCGQHMEMQAGQQGQLRQTENLGLLACG